jgi:preprotein translocase SecE subunit
MATEERLPEESAAKVGWFQGTIAELGRVVWPTREELFRMTGIVIFTVIAISGYIAIVDLILTEASKKVYGST